jgi:hypothetical protein
MPARTGVRTVGAGLGLSVGAHTMEGDVRLG